jgi:hypothetical protein
VAIFLDWLPEPHAIGEVGQVHFRPRPAAVRVRGIVDLHEQLTPPAALPLSDAAVDPLRRQWQRLDYGVELGQHGFT